MKMDRSRPTALLPRSNWDQYDTASSSDGAPILDFGFVFKVIRRRIGLIVACMLLALVIAAVIFATSTRYYSAGARVIVERASVDVLQKDAVLLEQNLNPAEADGLLQVIASDNVVGSAVDRLDLLSNPAFADNSVDLVGEARKWLYDQLRVFDWVAPLLPAAKPRVQDGASRQAAIDLVQQRLSVRRVGLSYVFVIEVKWPSPTLAARIANGLADAFIQDRLEQRTEEAKKATNWLDERLAETRTQVEQADAAVATFRSTANIVDAGREGLLNEQQLALLNEKLANSAVEARSRAGEVQRFASVTPETLTSSSLGNSPEEQSLAELRTQLIALRDKVADAESRFGPEHAVTQDLKEQLQRLGDRVASQIDVVRQGLAAASDEAKVAEGALRTQVEELSRQSSAVGSAQIKLKGLESEAAVFRSLYDGYLQRYTQTIQQLSFPAADARVITPATPPDSDTFSGTTLGILALAIGASFGLGAALVRERMDRTIRTTWQLRLTTGVPTLGILPAAGSALGHSSVPAVLPLRDKAKVVQPPPIVAPLCRLVISDPMSRFTETIRRVRIAVDNSPHNAPCQIVGFISAETSAARGIVAANYAQLVAMSGRKTLLLDLDMRVPALTRAIAPTADCGLADYAEPGAIVNAETAVYVDLTSRLKFLPARGLDKSKADTPDYFNTDRMARILTQLMATYECIVIDLPPVAISSDAVSLAGLVTGYVIVSEWGKTSGDTLAASLSESGISYDRLIGSVLSEVSMSKYARYERVAGV